MHAQRNVGEDVPWMPGTADLVESVDQAVLVVGLECNAEVDRDASRRWSQALPSHRDSIPCMLHTLVVPTWRKAYRGIAERPSGSEDGEHREQMVVAHVTGGSPRWCQP